MSDSFYYSPTITMGSASTSTSGWVRVGGEQGLVEMKKESNLPVKIYFKLMKKKMGVLKDIAYKKRMEKIQILCDKAARDGQVAFSEELARKFLVLAREAELYAMNKRIFLDYSIYTKFCGKTERKVCLTKLENYARPIPQKVLSEKEKLHKLNLFDDYVVMHYDAPHVVRDTEVEIVERQKDPILFGRIEFSSRLYFIDDWEDELCDLTLDDIVSKLELEDEDMTLPKNPTLNS